jgi:tRNA (uracil-5-)-methyltransferase
LRKQKQGDEDALEEQPEWLKIGFNVVGTRKVLDIEECPIATPVINEALTVERANIIQSIHSSNPFLSKADSSI